MKGSENELPGWRLDRLDYPTFRMTLLAKAMDRLTIRQLAEQFDLSYAQWRVIARLGETADGATVGSIANQAWVDRAEVSRAASALQKKGLLERKENPDDRRATVLLLNPRGEELYRRVAKERARFHEELVSDLDREDLLRLDDLINRIRGKLEEKAESLSGISPANPSYDQA